MSQLKPLIGEFNKTVYLKPKGKELPNQLISSYRENYKSSKGIRTLFRNVEGYGILILLLLTINPIYGQNDSVSTFSNITITDTTFASTGFEQSPLRKKPKIGSKPIIQIPPRTRVSIIEKSNYPYVNVQYGQYIGYLSITYLVRDENVRQLEKEYFPSVSFPPPKVQKQIPTNTLKRKPSAKCPTVQCFGYTQKGNRCRNRTTNCSKRCYLHD